MLQRKQNGGLFFLKLLVSVSDIGECAQHPCENSGTCVELEHSFTCQCYLFTGKLCEKGACYSAVFTTLLFCPCTWFSMANCVFKPLQKMTEDNNSDEDDDYFTYYDTM